jgi:hypothetical protein
MDNIIDTITRRIRAKKRGWVFAPKDFMDIGTRAAVDQVLCRLTKRGMIRRLDRGVYDFPVQHKLLGIISPGADDLAKVITAKTGDISYPSGAMAANMLGFSTQVPAKPVYLTNGHSRTKNISGRKIIIKHARVPILSGVPDAVNFTLQALYYLGKDNIDSQILNRCSKILSDGDMAALNVATSKVPGWVADIIHKIQNIKYGKISGTA